MPAVTVFYKKKKNIVTERAISNRYDTTCAAQNYGNRGI